MASLSTLEADVHTKHANKQTTNTPRQGNDPRRCWAMMNVVVVERLIHMDTFTMKFGSTYY